MPNRKVSHAVLEMIVALADNAKLSLTELTTGLPVSESDLRRRLGGLEWELAAELMERIEAGIGPERIRELAGRIPDISSVARGLLGRFVKPRLMLSFVFRTIGPTMYPMYDVRFEELEQPDGTVVAHLVLRLKEGFRECRTFFDLNGIGTAALPTVIGQPALEFRAEATGRGGEYWFTLPR